MDTPKTHFTYQISNNRLQKHYIGARSCKGLPDIGINYFSSSKDKDFIKDQRTNPQDYSYLVLKEHVTREDAIKHEIYLHTYNDVGVNPKFYNRSKQTSIGFDTTGTTMSAEAKKAQSLRNTGTCNPNYGSIHQDDSVKAKMSRNRAGKCLKEKHPLYGKQRSDAVKAKSKITKKCSVIYLGRVYNSVAACTRATGVSRFRILTNRHTVFVEVI